MSSTTIISQSQESGGEREHGGGAGEWPAPSDGDVKRKNRKLNEDNEYDYYYSDDDKNAPPQTEENQSGGKFGLKNAMAAKLMGNLENKTDENIAMSSGAEGEKNAEEKDITSQKEQLQENIKEEQNDQSINEDKAKEETMQQDDEILKEPNQESTEKALNQSEDASQENDKVKEEDIVQESEIKQESDLQQKSDIAQESDVKQENDLAQESDIKQGSDMTQESDIKQGSDMAQENDIKQESDKAQESDIAQGSDIKPKSDIPQESDVKQENDLAQESGIKQESDIMQDEDKKQEETLQEEAQENEIEEQNQGEIGKEQAQKSMKEEEKSQEGDIDKERIAEKDQFHGKLDGNEPMDEAIKLDFKNTTEPDQENSSVKELTQDNENSRDLSPDNEVKPEEKQIPNEQEIIANSENPSEIKHDEIIAEDQFVPEDVQPEEASLDVKERSFPVNEEQTNPLGNPILDTLLDNKKDEHEMIQNEKLPNEPNNKTDPKVKDITNPSKESNDDEIQKQEPKVEAINQPETKTEPINEPEPKTEQMNEPEPKTDQTNEQENNENKEHPNDSHQNQEGSDQKPKRKLTPEEAELEAALEGVVNRFDPPPAHLRLKLKQLISHKRVEALVACDYETAEQQDKNDWSLNYTLQLEQERKNEDNQMDLLYNRYQTIQTKLNNENEYWDEQIQICNQMNNDYVVKLKEKHAKQHEQFNAKWRDPNFLVQFNKPSQRLLQYREMEKARAVSRLYSQATEIKLVADKLQKEETQNAQKKIAYQMQLDRQRMIERQEGEIKGNEDHHQLTISNLTKERERSIFPLVSALAQIRAKKSTIVVSGKPHSATITRNINESGQSTLSPRTQAKYVSYRSEKRKTRLDVQPIDEKSLSPKKRPTSRSTIKRPMTASIQRGKFNPRK